MNDGDQADQAFCLVMEASRVSPKFAARMKSLEFLSTRRAPLEYYRETLLKRSWPQLKVATVPHVLSFKVVFLDFYALTKDINTFAVPKTKAEDPVSTSQILNDIFSLNERNRI